MGKYIDQAERKNLYSCARICVEVDLESGFPEAIQETKIEGETILDLSKQKWKKNVGKAVSARGTSRGIAT